MLTNNDIEEIKEIEFGADIEQTISPLHQICPRNGETIRVAFLNDVCKPKAAFYHWHRGGFYRCNSKVDGPQAPCCKINRSWTAVCLALVYLDSNPAAKLKEGDEIRYRIGYVGLARTAYAHVSEFLNESNSCDLYYAKDGGGYSFRGAARIALWRKSQQVERILSEAGRWSDGTKLTSKLGTKLTDEQWERLLRTGSIHELEDPDQW